MIQRLENIDIVLKDQMIESGTLVFDKVIQAVYPEAVSITARESQKISIPHAKYVFPGFIDLHTHGFGGADAMEGKQHLLKMSKLLVKQGTTSFLPTSVTCSKSKTRDFLKAVGETSSYEGAKILGAHLEGPFISSKYRGAHPQKHIAMIGESDIQEYIDQISMITYAPEKDPHYIFAHTMMAHGVVMSIGHSNATYEQTVEAYDEGIQHITHLFNAMPPLHHRVPGPIGAAMVRPFTVDVILDGIHSHLMFMLHYIQAMGVERIAVITDAIPPAGLPKGTYTFAGAPVLVDERRAVREDGTLAGSVLTMQQVLKHMMASQVFTFPEISQMMSYRPACILHREDHIGEIKKGYASDFVVTDVEGNILAVWVDGIQCG